MGVRFNAILLFSVLSLQTFHTAKAAETLQIECTADTTLHELSPNNNMGAHTHVAAGSTQHNAPGGGLVRTRGLFGFPINQIPSGSSIVAATVRINVIPADRPLTTPASYSLHRLLQPWGEGAGAGNTGRDALTGEAAWTWRARPEAWGAPGGAAGVDYVAAPSASAIVNDVGAYDFSSSALAADVKAWLANPDSNFGWILICDNEQASQSARRFGSREGGAPAVLAVQYSALAPEVRLQNPQVTPAGIVLAWLGGNPPFQLQATADLSLPSWNNLGQPTTNRSVTISATGRAQFFRVATNLGAP